MVSYTSPLRQPQMVPSFILLGGKATWLSEKFIYE